MSGPARSDVSGLLKRSDTGFDGGLVVGRPGLLVDELSDSGDSRFFESQHTEPRSHKLGGLLMITDGFEQNADMRPGRQTPGHRLSGAGDVVLGLAVVVAAALVEAGAAGRGVVELGRTVLDGRAEVEVPFLVSPPEDAPLPVSRRLMQHLPPFEHTAFVSM